MSGGFSKFYKNGVTDYYTKNSDFYNNPHSTYICECIKILSTRIKIRGSILDLCCGSGEVTKALQNLKINNLEILGCDPFTHKLYSENTEMKCYKYSFDDIMNQCFENEKYDLIICSYALHLCNKSKLKLVCLELAKITNIFCVITPHKKPILTPEMGWNLAYEFKFMKSRVYIYKKL